MILMKYYKNKILLEKIFKKEERKKALATKEGRFNSRGRHEVLGQMSCQVMKADMG